MNKRIKRTVLAFCALVLLAACTKSDDAADESQLGYRLPPGETHLTFTLPEARPNGDFKGRPALTFRIPKEYVRFQSVLSKNGKIDQVRLQIELPGPRPWQEQSWLKGKEGTAERDKFTKDWIGRFIVRLGSGSGMGGRKMLLHDIRPDNVHGRKDIVADGQAHGLVRYSAIRCYTPKDLENPQLKAFLDAKPADDPLPEAHCRADRRAATLFSPTTVTDSNEVVFFNCADHSCDVNFNFEEVGASMPLRQELLPRWPEIVNPTRELLRSFIVQRGTSSAQQPTSPTDPLR